MYKGCSYDIASNNITQNFCTLFNEDITSVLEYWSDLQAYYQKGYGHSLNYKIACLLLQDIFAVHNDYVTGENTNLRAKFRFAHAETVMPLIALLVRVNTHPHRVSNMIRMIGAVQRSNAADGQLVRCSEGTEAMEDQ